jgi:hypothetical protein
MPSPLVESFELLVDVEQLAPRLEAAATALEQLPHLEAERGWLAAARERLPQQRFGSLLDRALRLPELESLKSEHGKRLQIAVADEVDRLQGAITLAGTARSPLLEVLFHNLKMPPLRKCPRPELDKFCTELERRLASTYTKRVLGTDRYKPVVAAIEVLANAVATWRSVFMEPPLEEVEAATVRDELMAAGQAVELPVRQAKLLAQAALLPAAGLLDGEGVLTVRGKQRDLSHPLLEQDPPDPLLPMADERAEIAALHGSS